MKFRVLIQADNGSEIDLQIDDAKALVLALRTLAQLIANSGWIGGTREIALAMIVNLRARL